MSTSARAHKPVPGGARKPAVAAHASGPAHEDAWDRPQEPHAAAQRVVAQAGRPLPDALRRQVEARFGHDFSSVRIHTDTEAARSADTEDAEAYTFGRHIVFGAGRFAPEHAQGRRLIAHELAHVVQQGRGAAAGMSSAQPAQPAGAEAQADAAASAAVLPAAAGAVPVAVAGTAAPGIAHKKKQRGKGEGDDEYEDEEEVRRRERSRQRAQDKGQAQDRRADRREARGGMQETGAVRAKRELGRMMDEAKSGDLAQLSPDEKLARLRRFKQVLKDSDMPTLQRNQLQGAYDEELRTPRVRLLGKPQTKWVAGGPELPGMVLTPGEVSYAQPDNSKNIKTRNKSGDKIKVRGHVNLKSDTLEGIPMSRVRDKGKRYAEQAKRNAKHLPTGEPIVIDFAEPGTPEIRQEMCKKLFAKGGPVKEVRFHTHTIRREEWEAAEKVRVEAERRQRERERRAAKKAAKGGAGKKPAAAGGAKAGTAKPSSKKKTPPKATPPAKKAAAKKAPAKASAAKKAAPAAAKPKAAAAKKAAATKAPATKSVVAKAPAKKAAAKKSPAEKKAKAKPAVPVADAAAAPVAAKPKPAARKRGKAAVPAQPKATVQDDLALPPTPRQARPRKPAAKKAAASPAKAQQPQAQPQQPPPQQQPKKAAPARKQAKPVKPAVPAVVAGTAPPVAAATAKPAAKAGPKAAAKTPAKGPAKPAAKKPPGPTSTTDMQVDRGASAIGGPGKLGAGANAGMQSRTDYGKGRSATHSAAFGGKAWVEVTEVPYSKPARFRVVFHVNVAGQAGAGVEQQGRGGTSITAGAAASGSIDLTVAHDFSAEETQKYMASVNAGSGGAWRELRVAQLAAAGSIADAQALAGQMRALAGSPAGLAQMKEGDEVALGATGSIEANVGGSVGKGLSVGLQAGVGKTAGMERSVSLRDGKYTVTISSSEGTSGRLGASGGYGVASMGMSREVRDSRGTSVSFVIDAKDPNRDARFAEITAAGSMEALTDLKGKYPDVGGSRTDSRGRATDDTTTAGALGVSVDILDQGETSEEVTVGPDGVSRVYSAQATGGARLRVGDRTVASASDTNAFVGGAGPDNVGWGETRNEQRSLDYGASARKLATNFGKAPVGTAIGVVTGSMPVVQETVQQHGAAMTDDGYAELIGRAQDPAKWSQAWSGSFGTWEAWMKVRHQVLAAGDNRQMIAKAISDFEGKSGRGRSDTVQKALGGTAIVFEFPDSIADQKPLYDALIVGNPLAAAEAAGDGPQQLTRLRADLEKLAALDKKISDHAADFQRPGDFIEMRQRIGERQLALRGAAARLQPKAPAGAGAAPKAAAPDPGVTTVPTADEMAAQQADETEHRQQQIEAATARLRSYRGVEQGVFAAMEAEFKGYTVMGYEMPKLSQPSVIGLIAQENKLKDAYPKWGKDIALLRRLLGESGGDASQADAYRPNRARYLELDRQIPYHSYGSGMPGYEEI